ncbi:MAG: GNAT family N-acetyltransferase [bacterium]
MMNTSNNSDGKYLVRVMKDTANSKGPPLCIPVFSPNPVLLRPVATQPDFLDAKDISCLTKWRNRFVRSFLTEFEANEKQTSDWLVNLVGPGDTKILFMVDDLFGRTFGYMGLDFIDWEKASGEADAVVRGAEAPRGIMSLTLRTMLIWARRQLGLNTLGVRVLSDNTALEFYRKSGFHEIRRIPLRRVEEKNKICWVEDISVQSSERSLVHMLWLPAE